MSGALHFDSDAMRVQLNRTRDSVARNFLFKHGYNSSSFALPDFYVPTGFESMNLERIVWGVSNTSKLLPSEPINLVAPKGAVGWRRFSLLHPYAYWHIVTELTSVDAWPTVRERLGRPTGVASYTVPSFRMTEKTTQGANISSWLRFAEQNLIADASTFSHLAITDVQNFYPSVYTHSLAWAVNTRPVIKANQKNTRDYVGNRIDRLFQSAHHNQTNGIRHRWLCINWISIASRHGLSGHRYRDNQRFK